MNSSVRALDLALLVTYMYSLRRSLALAEPCGPTKTLGTDVA